MILVVGDVMTDVIVRPLGPPAHATDCPAAIVSRPGGSAANVACWIGHFGGRVAFVGRVGRPDSATQRAALERHGVRACLAIDDAGATGSVVAMVEPDGERSFYTDRGANRTLCAADLPPSLLDGVRAVHVSGHVLVDPAPRSAALALLQAARRRDCRVSVDAGSLAWLQVVGPAQFAAWIGQADTCFANAAEAVALQPHWRGETLVVTEGARGARAIRGGESFSAAAPATEIVDTIGAGDAFVAGFLYAQAGGAGLEDCLAAGVRGAGHALRMAGGRPDGAT